MGGGSRPPRRTAAPRGIAGDGRRAHRVRARGDWGHRPAASVGRPGGARAVIQATPARRPSSRPRPDRATRGRPSGREVVGRPSGGARAAPRRRSDGPRATAGPRATLLRRSSDARAALGRPSDGIPAALTRPSGGPRAALRRPSGDAVPGLPSATLDRPSGGPRAFLGSARAAGDRRASGSRSVCRGAEAHRRSWSHDQRSRFVRGGLHCGIAPGRVDYVRRIIRPGPRRGVSQCMCPTVPGA